MRPVPEPGASGEAEAGPIPVPMPIGPDVSTLYVTPADSPGGPHNRIVVYDWFTRLGTPPRAGNALRILVDGEEAWAALAADLEATRQEVQIATWVCRPDMELVRPPPLAVNEPPLRRRHRLGEQLERLAAAGVKTRLLIWGMTNTPIVNPWLRRWHWQSEGRIEVLEQDHQRFIGSHHQKTITLDGRVGYCGGMNLKENDWDTTGHVLFEPRRMPHASTAEARARVAARGRVPAFPPRHDLMVRLEGPAVADLLANFRSRWNASIRSRRRSVSGWLGERVRRWLRQPPFTPLAPQAAPVPPAGDQLVQIVRTTPTGEAGILDTYRRAVRNARRYVYIENQYFRSPLLGRELAAALARNAELRLIVAVIPIREGRRAWFDPSAYWTAYTQNLIRKVRPDFRLTRLLVHDLDARRRSVWAPIDLHAKVMIIDDDWFTVGSANINDRGFKSESEINVVALDTREARALRLRLMAEHLEVPLEEAPTRLGNAAAAFDLWERHAAENARRRAAGEAPLSRVHAFLQEGEDEEILGIDASVF